MKIGWPILGALLAFVLVPGASFAQETYDVVIRNGRVLDGTGNPWFLADLGLRGDRIAAIGDLSSAQSAEVIDAEGLYVAPGFIDSHTHAGGGLATEELSHARPLLAQGITTIFANPDGGGPVDLAEQRAALLQHGLGVNVAQMVSHGSIRREVLGEEDRGPTDEELNRMKALVQAGMEEGAWGMSSGTFYVPGSYSEPAEIIELARVVARYGGAYQSHIRDESDYTTGLVASVDEVIDVARCAELPAVVTHIKALGPAVWGYSLALVRRIERAREEGLQVYADQYPYLASATGLSSALLPRWSQAGGRDSLLARFANPTTLAQIRREMEDNLARRGGASRIQFRRVEFDESLEGRRLDEVAREWSMSPVGVAVELLKQGGPRIVSFNMDPEDVRILMAQPWTMTSSDGDLVPWQEGVPHPRSYGAFPRKIRSYVVEERVLDLASAIRSMTSLPATVYRVEDRGVIREGAAADLVVFDLGLVRDLATYAQPHQLAEGMVHVIVNGEAAVRDRAFTGRLAGRVLRRR